MALASACGVLPEGWLYTTRVAPTAATVVWTLAAEATVACRDAQNRVVEAATHGTASGPRWARLEGLTPDTPYRCELRSTALAKPRRFRFRTAALPGTPFRFAVVGDTGDFSPEARALPRRILAGHPAFLVHVGDLAYPHGTALQLDRRFFRAYRRLLERVPLFPAPGNHDLLRSSAYRTVFGPAAAGGEDDLRYAWSWGDAGFVSLDTPGVAAGGGGLAWTAAALASFAPSAWRIAAVHEPPFSPGVKGIKEGLRRTLEPILERGGVALLLTGHEHLYARTDPVCEVVPEARVVEVITGGGGGASLDQPVPQPKFATVLSTTHYVLVHVDAKRIVLRAIGLDGRVLDRARLVRGAATPCRQGRWRLGKPPT